MQLEKELGVLLRELQGALGGELEGVAKHIRELTA